MTSGRKRMVRVVDASVEHMGTGATGVMKSTKRISGQRHKAIGKSDDFSVENDENCSPSSTAKTECLQNPNKDTGLRETIRKLPVTDLYPGQILRPSAKIKLQLFPIDEGTRIGLEKDGFHPYLELTLSNRKKISSVLKHLNSKWGNSSVALGEPMLFPYNTVENLASYKWTINDDHINAADVYAAIGTPAVFRLRYGWFFNSKDETFGMPSTSTSIESCLKSDIHQGRTSKVENPYGEVKQIEGKSEESEAIIVNGATNAVLAEKVSSDRPIDPLDNEVRTDGSIGQSSLLWADSLTNISIGGLLSEASLQGGFANGDAKSNGTNASLQPPQLICDSFDAFIAGQMNHSQGPRPSSYESHSSILDAEDTCHAFAFQKFSSSPKDAPALGGSASSKSLSQGADTKSIKFPNLIEANVQSGLAEGGHACQESKTDLSLSSRVYNDESSLGLSGIKWTDSLGPFDLGLSSSRKIISGDSVSMSGIVN